MITIATGPISEQDEERLGLVSTHAYAVLDVKEVKGIRLLQVKNPWSHKRWRGKYSHLDTKNWTAELKSALNYDQIGAMQQDNGIFWIDWDSVLQYFHGIHLNWNPDLFRHRTTLHGYWDKGKGPKKDLYNVGYNPQFSLEATVADDKDAAMWLLLTKHITRKEENKDFITLNVYDNTNGKRVYYPESPMSRGYYINSPHYLVRFNVPKGTHRYTLVVSQFEKLNTLNFTISGYSFAPFKLVQLPQHGSHFAMEKKIVSEWQPSNAGGCSNYAGHCMNPMYRMVFPNGSPTIKSSLHISLEAPRQIAVNIKLLKLTGIAKIFPR